MQITLKILVSRYRSIIRKSILVSYHDIMKYRLIEKANPLKRDEKKWYGNPVNSGKITQRMLAQELTEKSSLTIGDVMNVLENLLHELPKGLIDGKTVSLGDFGSFRLNLSSEGVVNKKDFNPQTFKPKVIFTP